jgi:hypothetical protein
MTFHFFGYRGGHTKQAEGILTASRAAKTALRDYEKTFKDLARYDRGEQLALPR